MKLNLVFIALALTVIVLYAHKKQREHTQDLRELTTASGSFGPIFVFLLMAGEIFTTYTLLGHSGMAYSEGGAALFSTLMVVMAIPAMYFIEPLIWKRSRSLGAVSQAEYFGHAFDSVFFSKIVAVVASIGLISYMALQLSGLSLIISELTHQAMSVETTRMCAAIGIVVFSLVAGLRGVANLALLKDVVMILIIWTVGVYLPVHLFGSWSQVVHSIESIHPHFSIIHGHSRGFVWFFTTGLIAAVGYVFWPHSFQAIFTSSSPQALRKSAVWTPLYVLLTFPLTIAGLTAHLEDPHIPSDHRDLALLRLALHHLPEPVIVVLTVGSILTALIPCTVMIISLSSNIVRTFAPEPQEDVEHLPTWSVHRILGTEERQALTIKLLIPVLAVLAALVSIYGGKNIAQLLVSGYGIISQLTIPCAIDIWQWKHPHRRALPKGPIIAGVIVGVTFACATSFMGVNFELLHRFLPYQLAEINLGVVAYIVNILVVVLGTWLVRAYQARSRVLT